MRLITLVYIPGVLERRKFRRLLGQYECTYKETRGFFDRTFYVIADIEDHVKLAKEFYRG